MADKNAYEIRSDVLALAKDYLDGQAALNAQFLDAIRAGVVTAAMTPITADMLKPYTVEDIVNTAQKMYDFVKREQRP